MGRVYDVYNKFSIVGIVIGLLLGIYLAINHNDSNLWINALPYILAFSLLMTIFPITTSLSDNLKNGSKFPTRALIEAFFLNFAIIGVCTAFGVVIGSFLIGNVIADNTKLPSILDWFKF